MAACGPFLGEVCVAFRFVFYRWFSWSHRGVVAESVPGSLFFVGQNGGVVVESSRSRSSPRHGGSRSGLVFNRWDGGVGAESARSRRGVTAGPLRESLFLWAGFGHHDVHASHHHQHTNLCNHVACCCCRCCCCCCCTAWCCSRRHPQPAEWASVCHGVEKCLEVSFHGSDNFSVAS